MVSFGQRDIAAVDTGQVLLASSNLDEPLVSLFGCRTLPGLGGTQVSMAFALRSELSSPGSPDDLRTL